MVFSAFWFSGKRGTFCGVLRLPLFCACGGCSFSALSVFPCVMRECHSVFHVGIWSYGYTLCCFIVGRALVGVVLFVFRLDALVVRLEGIAVCGYCGVHALHRSVCFLVVFARCCMSMQALLVGKPEWFKFCQVVCPRSKNPDRCI